MNHKTALSKLQSSLSAQQLAWFEIVMDDIRFKRNARAIHYEMMERHFIKKEKNLEKENEALKKLLLEINHPDYRTVYVKEDK